ncbi:hypothetical protein NE626_09240 [Intestinimonas massiliensis]|uniref:Uncharacterized protein n=1 Tax=Intestinimonas massiliensis (ex Afouda et al. 2020) TaxID=1673721 RepID=A0ABS9M938_9FIRM|nr:hypothetical protein [Intestinimonas massiliensis (ex Afouda et al. 2020)]MCG4527276.1 hypothetical protein [Intestinimonas massiliensis (ex Afouda et al. 2020)]MCQ4807006.1 hypothetical protein [Intestinimonas massiliensis (ex Afouda et al. 2020)]
MTYAVYRMKPFRRLTEPMHIAFKTNRGRTACHQHDRHNRATAVKAKQAGIADDFVFYESSLAYLFAKLAAL